MELRPLTESDMEQVRVWRHDVPNVLRTPYMLTEEMQQDYYERVICNRDSSTRYWGLWDEVPDVPWELDEFIGYGGIENISWENGNGEISLLISPDYRGKGYGKQAVGLFLDQAFNNLRLEHIYGECYECGPWRFWNSMALIYSKATRDLACWLPARKYYQGEYHDSYYFTFSAESYRRYTRENRFPANPPEEYQGVSRQADTGIYDGGSQSVRPF